MWDVSQKGTFLIKPIKFKQDECVQGMDEMRDGDNDVTDEIGSSSGAAQGQEVF